MITASKTLHQISWPILKKNIDICENKRSSSLGILFAAEKDLPESDSNFLDYYLIKILNLLTLKNMVYRSFPVIVSVAQDSPAHEAKLLEHDIILAINK